MAAVKIQHKNCLQSTLWKKIINTLFASLGLGYSPRPAVSGHTQDLWHSFSQYGPPGRQITYIYRYRVKCEEREKEFDSYYVAHSQIVHSGRKVKCLPVIESSHLKLSGFFSKSSAAVKSNCRGLRVEGAMLISIY